MPPSCTPGNQSVADYFLRHLMPLSCFQWQFCGSTWCSWFVVPVKMPVIDSFGRFSEEQCAVHMMYGVPSSYARCCSCRLLLPALLIAIVVLAALLLYVVQYALLTRHALFANRDIAEIVLTASTSTATVIAVIVAAIARITTHRPFLPAAHGNPESSKRDPRSGFLHPYHTCKGRLFGKHRKRSFRSLGPFLDYQVVPKQGLCFYLLPCASLVRSQASHLA